MSLTQRFKNLLADLSSELADVKLEAASLKKKLTALQDENALLMSRSGFRGGGSENSNLKKMGPEQQAKACEK